MSGPADDLMKATLEAADEAMIRIEMVDGMPVWEAMPGPKHQRLVVAIANSVTRTSGQGGDCGCHTLTDINVSFPDGSFKRPDVAIFCTAPDEEAPRVEILPDAVVEVLSKGYEAKDLQVGLPFYLAQGVKDVVIYDPWTLVVLHARREGTKRLVAPTTIQCECGWTLSLPL